MAGKRQTYIDRRKKRPRSMTKRTKGALYISIAGFVLLFCLVRCGSYLNNKRERHYRDSQTESECLKQVIIPSDVPEIKVRYTGFDVSFNPTMHQPNYVAWELTADKANGLEKRVSKFRQDSEVEGCATLDDYRNSGFDRGHMAPAGDMKWDAQAMSDSHYLTNICPQSHSLNGGRWASLEAVCREWVEKDSLLIIICGPVLSDRLTRTIGRSEIPVPERFFKVIIAPYAIPPRAIGFVMTNNTPEEGLEAMTTTVDRVEEITGFDFFSSLPDDIENEIESKANFRQWNARKKNL